MSVHSPRSTFHPVPCSSLPPSPPYLCTHRSGLPPARELLPGAQHPLRQLTQASGVTENSQPLHPEHSAKPTNHISKPHLLCSQTCTSARWAGLCSTWDPISWNHLPAPTSWSGTKAPASPGAWASSQPAGGSQGWGWSAGRQRLQPLPPLSWTPCAALLPGNVPRERGAKLGPPSRAGEIDPSLAGGEGGSRACRVEDAVAAILGKRTRSHEALAAT